MSPTVPSDRLEPGPLAVLLERLNEVPAGSLVDVAFEVLGPRLGLRHLWLYVADYGARTLEPVPSRTAPPPPPDSIPVSGSLPGRAFETGRVLEAHDGGGTTLWVPIRQRSDSIGVLGLGLGAPDGAAAALAPAIGLVIGGFVVGARRHSDVFEIARGARELRLAAAMQWDLLPLPSYIDPHLAVAGRLEPAYDIGGDAFDFAGGPERFDAAVFDAVGHGVGSTLLTTLAVGAYRFSRRRDPDLAEVAAAIEGAIALHAGVESFVTSFLCRLDHGTGRMRWVNAGHPPPLLVRDRSCSDLLPPRPSLPFGLAEGRREVQEVTLQPGDAVLLYTDGVIECRDPQGKPFGAERLADLAGRHVDREAQLPTIARLIIDAVLEHAGGRLRDDATLVVLRWGGPAGEA